MATEPFEQTDDRNTGGSDKQADLHATALRHAEEAWTAERLNIAEGREDQRFAFGEQWPANDKLERDRERRPSITINRLPQFKRQVTGDIRKDTPSSKVIPAKDATAKKAEILTGMIRNIEQQSNAKAAYVQAVENAVDVGMGTWRIITEYENDNAFEQVIRIERIQDPFGALCDATARKPDKSDARFWFVFDDMAEEEFKRQYPEATLDGFPTPPENGMVWRMDKTIRVAEYWYKEDETKTLELLEDGSTRYKGDDDADETADAKEGTTGNVIALPGAPRPPPPKVINTREVKTQKIMQVLMSGRETLTEPQEWAGRYIPIVCVIGEEARMDGRTLRKGMVRDAKGPQQVYNYMRTAATEFVSRQPSAPFVGTVKQFAGFEHEWADAGGGNKAFLPYNVDPQAQGPPQRSMPPSGATGLDQQAVIAANDIEAVIGIYKESLGAQSNANSGRAILARQREGDTGTYFFVDNLRTGLTYSAKILLDLIPKIYDTPRVVRTLKEDGDHEMVGINQAPPPGVEPDMLPEEVREALNDLSIGEYDVIVSTGPGYASKRQEASESMTEFIRAFPAAAPVIGDLVAKNQDWPGAEEIAKRLEGMQSHPPSPEVMANVQKTGAQTQLYLAQAEKTSVEAVGEGVSAFQMVQQMHMDLKAFMAQIAGLVPGNTPAQPAAPAPPPPGAMLNGPTSVGPMPPPNAGGEGELVDMPPNGGPNA